MRRFTIPPITISLDGAKATILEISKVALDEETKFYIVTCYVEYNNYKSKTFTLQVSNNKELIEKLRCEIAKMKWMIRLGHTYLFERIK